MAALVGLVPQVNANYELNKNLNVIPEGQLVPRHFRDHEYEFYAQDQWRIKPNFTFTYGLRYSILQPPFETTGTQVAPTISLHDWFNQRGIGCVARTGLRTAGRLWTRRPGEREATLLGYDYKDFAPRLAFAYSPKAEAG